MKRGKIRSAVIIKIMLLIAVITALVWGFLEWRVTPVVQSVSSIQGKSFAISAINQAAADVLEAEDLSDKDSITTSSDGMLRSLSTDTAAANRLKHMITLKAQESISDLKHKQINIPLGMIIGGEIIGPAGPDIPVFITLSGTADSDFEESFESAGINQTVHKLSLRITADLLIHTPSGTVSESVSTSFLIAETVIIGSVPVVDS